MKNLYDNNFEVEMIDKLKLLEVSPPNDLWNGIESSLNEKRRKRKITLTYYLAAASIALLFTIGGFLAVQNKVETISINQQKIELVKSPINKSDINKEQSEVIKNRKLSRNYNGNVENNPQEITSALNIEPSSKEILESKRSDEIPNVLESHLTINISENIEHEEISSRIVLSDKIKNSSLAITEVTEKKVKGRLYIAASAFPVYSFHTAGVFKQSGSQQEMGIMSWGGSILVRYLFCKNYSIETGLAYNVMGQEVKNIYIVSYDADGIDVNSFNGFNNSYGLLEVSNSGNLEALDVNGVKSLASKAMRVNSFNKVDALQRFRYIEIPVLLSKGFSVKGINLNFKVGYSAGFLVKNQLDLRGSNIHLSGKTLGVDNFISSTMASLGFSIPIIKHANLLVEPTFKLGIKSLSNSTTKSYPFSSFIKFGVEVPI